MSQSNLAQTEANSSSSSSMLQWVKSMPLFAPEERRKMAPFFSSLVVHAVILSLLAMWILPTLTHGADGDVVTTSSISTMAETAISLESVTFDLAGVATTPSSSNAAAVATDSLSFPATSNAVSVNGTKVRVAELQSRRVCFIPRCIRWTTLAMMR